MTFLGDNSQVNIGLLCSKGKWGQRLKAVCVKAGYLRTVQLFDSIETETQTSEFNLLFIDEQAKESFSGGELVDLLISQQKIQATTAIIMVGSETERHIQNYDSMLQLIYFLSDPFSDASLLSLIRRAVKAQQVFRPTLTSIKTGKLVYALRAINSLNESNITSEILDDYYKLQANLSFEMGKYQQVLSICNTPQLEHKKWTIWPKFKANYELGNWMFCQETLSQEAFLSLPDGPMKLFWQVRIYLEQENFESAFELINAYPSHEMSTSMTRLAFTIKSISGQWYEAEEFIDRKIRLAQHNKEIYGVLVMIQCNIFLYEFYGASSEQRQQEALPKLKQKLDEFKKNKISQHFSYDIELLEIFIKIAAAYKDKIGTEIEDIKHQLSILENKAFSPIMKSRVAFAWHLLKEHKKCFIALVNSDVAFGFMSLGSERLILSMVHKQVFNYIYPEQYRGKVFKMMGNEHAKNQRYKLACKAYARAMEQKCDVEITRKLLLRAMTNAGLEKFSGFQINKNGELI